jgi:hypothetical protein
VGNCNVVVDDKKSWGWRQQKLTLTTNIYNKKSLVTKKLLYIDQTDSMRKKIKINILDKISSRDEVYKLDTITWEYTKMQVERKVVRERITPIKRFMKTFLSWNQIAIYNTVWEDCKYLWVLWDCMGYDNEINFKKFKQEIWMSSASFSRLRKRMIEKWIIATDWVQFYLNPIIAIKSEAIPVSLVDLFAMKNHTLYNITKL